MRMWPYCVVLMLGLLSPIYALPAMMNKGISRPPQSGSRIGAAAIAAKTSFNSHLTAFRASAERLAYQNTGLWGAKKAVAKYGVDYDERLTGKVLNDAVNHKWDLTNGKVFGAAEVLGEGWLKKDGLSVANVLDVAGSLRVA